MLRHLSRVRLFATPWTVAPQAPLFIGFPRQEIILEIIILLNDRKKKKNHIDKRKPCPEEAVMSQGRWAALQAGKSKEVYSHLKLPK